jgi:hypothetical protein
MHENNCTHFQSTEKIYMYFVAENQLTHDCLTLCMECPSLVLYFSMYSNYAHLFIYICNDNKFIDSV